jgi:hypothetical protein
LWGDAQKQTAGIHSKRNFKLRRVALLSFSACLHLATGHSSEQRQRFQFRDLDISGDEDVLGRRPMRSYLP